MAAAAVGVFGNPINHGTRAQRAVAAKNNQNADGKLDQALLVLNQQQKAAAGRPNESTTFGNIYNATGGKITYVTAHDWSGKVVGGYPVTIQNGQWAVFKHVGTGGSVGAVVYNIQNIAESVVAWHATPPTRPGDGNDSAYCEMNDPGGFDHCNWDVIYERLIASGRESQASSDEYITEVSINGGGNPSYTASFYLDV